MIRQVIKRVLAHAGWELRRRTSRYSSMAGGLEWLADHALPFNTVLDVGASDGRWSLQCMDSFPEADYVLFEPQPAHTEGLAAFYRGRERQVELVRSAVGSVEGSTLFDASDPFGGAIAGGAGEHTIEVKLTTIDSTIARLGSKPPFLLKLDTHGFEKSILAGSQVTLQECEALVIEAYNFEISDEAWLFWELCAFLAQKGFRPVNLVDVLHRKSDNALWQMDLFFVRSTWSGFLNTEYE
jgi:FkbM family methyltransferase